MDCNSVELDIAKVGEGSRLLATRLFAKRPEVKQYARMEAAEDSDHFDLLLKIPSPTGDSNRTIVIWMEPDEEASVGFGEWHTHAGLLCFEDDPEKEADSIIDLVDAIMNDKVVLIYDMGGKHDGECGILDLREPDAFLEELTDQYSPGRICVVTWSGKHDREFGLDDLKSVD